MFSFIQFHIGSIEILKIYCNRIIQYHIIDYIKTLLTVSLTISLVLKHLFNE